MNDHTRETLHLLWAAAVVGVLSLNLLWPLDGQEGSWPWVGGLMAFPVAAALILARRPGNGVGLALGAVGIAAAVIFVLSWYALTRPDAPWSRQLEALEAAPAVLQFLGIVALLYVFPTGRALPGWHRAALRLFLVLMAAFAVVAVVKPGPLTLTGRPNPLGFGPSWFDAIWDHGFAVIPPFALAGIASLVVRWRRAGPVERAQLKWFVAGASTLATMLVVVAVAPEASEPSLGESIASAFVMVSFWALPVAVLVAVSRYRLFEIDRIVSRTATYAIVAAILGSVYAGSVVGLQTVLPAAGSDLAVAGSTLAIAALFAPLRRIVRGALVRRFHRSSYIAEQEVQRFSRLLRAELDLDALSHALCATAATTLAPSTVQVWFPAGRDGVGGEPVRS